MGDWTISADSQMGPMVMNLSIKTEAGKLQGEISSEQMPKSTISDILRSGPSLILSYTFDYQGNGVPVALTLTPNGDKVNVNMDFASGAFTLAGTATKAAAK